MLLQRDTRSELFAALAVVLGSNPRVTAEDRQGSLRISVQYNDVQKSIFLKR